MKFKLILPYFLLVSFLFSADTIKLELNSGEILIGQTESAKTDDSYLIKSDILGALTIPKEAVKSYILIVKETTKASVTMESSKEESNSLSTKATEVKEESKVLSPVNIADIYGKMKLLDAPKSWSGNVRIGMNLSFGDREYTQTYMRGKLKIQEEGSPHLFQFSGEYNYRETEQVNGDRYISADRYQLNFIYRWLFSESWFFQNVSNYRTDKLKGIDNELQNVFGYGYRTIFFDSLELLLGSGIGFQDRSINGLDEDTTFIVNVFQELNWKPTKKIKLNQTLNYFQNPKDMDIYNYEFILGFHYRLSDLLGFEMRYLIDFDNGITENIKEDSRFQNALIFHF